ncbi:neprilysin-4 [Drosophila eugracilis]|uniref:neprilysin-4 n=1 Tax=Drosophila eugracilis TaxID=29029 RepID=UPI001BDA6DCD|nr:neprilysin-4 [Drosophila eugracilis]
MCSISNRFRVSLSTGRIYILIFVFLSSCEARTIGDESQENAIIDDTAEYLRSYGAKMKSYMNFSVDPCEDFYEYACGNWKNVIPPRQSVNKRNNLLDIIYTIAEVTESLLSRSQLAEALNVSAELLVAQRFYNSCLKAQVLPLPAADPAYLSLIRSIGGFPAVDGDSWNSSNFNWFNMSAHLTNYGAQGLIKEDILPQYPFNPYFKLPDLGYDHFVHTDNIANSSTRAYILNEERMRGYLKAFNLTEDKISQVIVGVFDFWREALALKDKFNGDDSQCQDLTIQNNVTVFSQWNNYYEIAWNGMDFYNGSVPSEYCDFYYTELDKVCDRHMEAVANYLAMMLLYRMDAKLKEEKYHKEHCLLIVQFTLSHLFNKLYMPENFSEDIHSDIFSMVTELRKSLREVLRNAEWLDNETRQEALLKEASMTPVIGSYKNAAITDVLLNQIRNLTLFDDNYAKSLISLRKLGISLRRYNGLHFEDMSEDTKPLELLVGMQVNAFYYNLDNSIYVMAGILHPPVYHHLWPNSLKFGTLGYLIGHELTHGFDTSGSGFDGSGIIRNWWTEKSNAVFKERARCYVDHYSRYLIPEINRNINGNETKDENIADAGGLREALAAYRNHLKQIQISADETLAPQSDQMPGLDLSPEQLFFLGFGQLWCSSFKEEHYWEELNEKHTIDKYRVLGAVSNNDDFAEVYNCPVGSAMRPKAESCRVW